MKVRKKYLIIAAVILLLGALAGLGVTAVCGPHGRWHKGYHHGFHSEDVADFISWKMDRHVKDLNLNDKQRQEYEKTKEEIRASITEAMEERKKFHTIMHDEMSKESPDINGLANLMKERLKNMPDLIGKNIDLFVKFYNVLNDDQKAKVIEMFRERCG